VLVASLPAILVALVGTWGVFTNHGGGWIWPPDQVNVSEAVATSNYAELIRLLDNGDDPNRPSPVRAPFLLSKPVIATPIEAAVIGRNVTMLRLLLARGAVLTRSQAERLKCLNDEHPEAEVRAILDERSPAEPTCPVAE
jgi:hypothetical protein